MSCPKLPVQNLGQILLAVWIVFSVVFIGNVVLQSLKVNAQQEAAQAGYQQAIVDLVTQAQTCEAFPINLGENSIELKAVNCTPPAAAAE